MKLKTVKAKSAKATKGKATIKMVPAPKAEPTPVKAEFSKEATRLRHNLPLGFVVNEINKQFYTSFSLQSPIYTIRVISPRHIEDQEVAMPLIMSGCFHITILVGDQEIREIEVPNAKLTETVNHLASTLYDPLMVEAKKLVY